MTYEVHSRVAVTSYPTLKLKLVICIQCQNKLRTGFCVVAVASPALGSTDLAPQVPMEVEGRIDADF